MYILCTVYSVIVTHKLHSQSPMGTLLCPCDTQLTWVKFCAVVTYLDVLLLYSVGLLFSFFLRMVSTVTIAGQC